MIICAITNKVHSGGAGKSLRILLENMPQNVEPYILSTSPTAYTEQNRIKHRHINSGFLPLAYLSGAREPGFLNYLAWICRFPFSIVTCHKIKEINPDVVILNGFQALLYAPLCKKKGTYYILYARELLNPNKLTSKLVIKIIKKYIDHAICISENEEIIFNKIPISTSVVYNSSESINFDQIITKSKNKDFFDIGVFGTITHTKGQYLIIDFVEKYIKIIKSEKIRFYIFGGNSSFTTRKNGREELIKKIKRKKLTDYIKFPGWVDDVSSKMQQMDLILRTDTSGCPWGRDVIEAMSNGIPVVASGESQVFIKPRFNGYLFESENIDSMADCIFKISTDKHLQDTMKKNSMITASKLFNPSSNSRKVYNIIKNLTEERSIFRQL